MRPISWRASPGERLCAFGVLNWGFLSSAAVTLSSNVLSSKTRPAKLTVRSFFGRNGPLSQSHPNYEYRPGQLQMAEAVEAALTERRHLIVEAGTGTGKTLAYLLPSILSGKRIVISTGTKNLQEQLYFKDVPFLESVLGRNLAVYYMKGRSNYLCRQKLYDADREPILSGLQEIRDFKIIKEWEPETQTGDRSEVIELPEGSSTWWKLDARTERCAGQKCKQFDRCFITEMHRRALASDIIIVNHHLFFADLAFRDLPHGGILPDYSAVIFDEAHAIEDVAGQYFGLSVSNQQIHELIRDVSATSRQKLFAAPELDRSLVHLGDRTDDFFRPFPQEGRRALKDLPPLPADHDDAYRELLFSLDALCARLELVEGAIEQTLPLVRRAKLMGQALLFWAEHSDSGFVYWIEGRGKSLYLQATPINVAQTLEANLFEKVESVILTSATLTVAGDFEYTESRLGVPQAATLLTESHYDYASNVLLYVPRSLPDPRQPQFAARAAEEIV